MRLRLGGKVVSRLLRGVPRSMLPCSKLIRAAANGIIKHSKGHQRSDECHERKRANSTRRQTGGAAAGG
jgi:hypothetical protein